MSLNIEKINCEINKFVKDREWDEFHSVKNLCMALSVEVGELVEIFQWLKEEESNQAKNNSDLKTRIEEEIADVFIYLMRIAQKTEVDIEKEILSKIQKNALKYPIDKCKGSSRKYNEL